MGLNITFLIPDDKDLVELLRSDYAENFADQAADRIEKLSQDYAEACDEAAVCYIKQCKAESKLDKALAALDEAITCLRNAGILYDRKIREFVDDGFRSHSRYRSNSIPALSRDLEQVRQDIADLRQAVRYANDHADQAKSERDAALARAEKAEADRDEWRKTAITKIEGKTE